MNINKLTFYFFNRLGLFVFLLTASSHGFGQQAFTPKQQRLQNRIDRLINKRYGNDSIKYQVGYDSITKRLVMYKPTTLQRVQIIRMNNLLAKRIDSLKLVKTKDSVITEDLRGKYNMVQDWLSNNRSQFAIIISSRDSLIKRLKAQITRDSSLILNLSQPSPVPQNGNVKPTSALVNQTKPSQRLFAEDSTLKGLNRRLSVEDSTLKELNRCLDEQYKEALAEIDRLKRPATPVSPIKTNSAFSLDMIVIDCLCLVIFLLIWPSLRPHAGFVRFYSCLVLNETDDVVFADVYLKEQNVTELRKFEKGPLKKILAAQPEGSKVFEVGIISKPGKKEFIYRKGKADVKQTFDNFYDKPNHAE